MTLIELRRELGWNQGTLAAKLSVTARTLSNWENGYWLPPVKQRLHVLLALRDVPPEYVVTFAEQLGLAQDPAHDAFLQPYRDAVGGRGARAAADDALLKKTVDDAVKEVARALGARADDVRAGVARVLEAAGRLGATVDELRRVVKT